MENFTRKRALCAGKKLGKVPLPLLKNIALMPLLQIPEPVPSLSWHGARIGGIRDFPAIKIIVILQVHMYCGLSVKNTHEMPNAFYLRWFLCEWSAKI